MCFMGGKAMRTEIDKTATKHEKSNIEYAVKIINNQCLYRASISEEQTLLTYVEVLRDVDKIKKITALLKYAQKAVNISKEFHGFYL